MNFFNKTYSYLKNFPYLSIGILLGLLVGYSPLHGQTITITSLTTGLAANPIVGGSTDKAVFGISLDKSGGGTASVFTMTILLSSDPAGKFTNARLYKSTDNSFGGIGAETLITTGTINAAPTSTIVFTGTPITNFGGSPGGAIEYYFIVVDIAPTASGTIECSTNDTKIGTPATVNAATLAGTLYTLNPLTATLTQLTTGLAPSPLVAGSTGMGILGFSLSSNGTQTISSINIPFSSDPTGKINNYALVQSTDNSLSTLGDNTTLTGLTFTPSATQVSISGLTENISSTPKNYFLVVNVNPGVTAATPALQPSLASTNITVNQGVVTGSITGTNYAFNTLSITLAQVTGGIAPSPLNSASSNNAILGFSLTSNGNPVFTGVNIQTSTTATGKINNIRVFSSADNTFDIGDVSLGGATVNVTATEIQVSTLNQTLTSTPNYYFIVADVAPNVNATTPQFLPSFTQANLAFSVGGASAATVTGTNYSFVDVIPPTLSFNPLNGATNVLVGTNLVITADEAIRKIDNTTITATDLLTLVSLLDPGNNPVPFMASIDATNTVITINPNSNLLGSTTYTLSVSPIEDFFNNATGTNTISFTTEPAPSITSFTPTSTCIGQNVTITGNNFGASVPSVSVNGTMATVVSNTATQIVFTVPTGATTGTIQVTNNVSGLSGISASALIVKPAIDLAMAVTPSNATPNTNQNFNILVGGATQPTVSYRVRRISPSIGAFSAAQTGNGGQLTFGAYSHNTAGVYIYEVEASSPNCTTVTLTQKATVTIAVLQANAGTNSTICNGTKVTLGGSPTALGGSGLFSITWSANPADASLAGQTSNTNPIVNPAVTTTYTVSVNDGNATVTSQVTITVNQLTPANQLAIVLTPTKPNDIYLIGDNPVELTYTLNGVAGSFVGQTKFQGPGVNSSGIKKYFYPNAANIGNNTIELVYENASGCLTTISKNVFVQDNGVFISGLSSQYCEGAQATPVINPLKQYNPIKLDLSSIGWGIYYFPGIRYTYANSVQLVDYWSGSIFPAGGAYTVNNLNMTLNTGLTGSNWKYFNLYYKVDVLAYNDLDPANPTITSTYYQYFPVYFYVIPKPPLYSLLPTEVCENSAPFLMNVQPTGGSFLLNGAATTPSFDPSTVGLPDVNTVTYNYTDPNTTCTNSISQTLTINRLPGIDFTFNNGCVGQVIQFNPLFANPNNIPFNYSWDSDGNGQYDTTLFTNLPIPLKRIYRIPSTYPIKLQVNTNKGCVKSLTKSLVIGDVPDLKLTWYNVCDGDPSRLAFKSNFFNTTPVDVDSIIWDFGDGNLVKKKSPVLADTAVFNNYATTGYYNASIKLTTDLNCSNKITTQIYKVAKTGVIGKIPYYENFDKSAFELQQWKSGGTNASWAWGTPAAPRINADASGTGKAWVTNLTGIYNVSEDSWVHSPCVNLTNIQRPMLFADIRCLLTDDVDGVVLQYNTKNTTNNENDWKTLGQVGSGKNWYDQIGIIANPGNQSLSQTGWTGIRDTLLWRRAILPLDNIIAGIPILERDRVRFRFALGSENFITKLEGFGFDNFKIAQRDRVVLIEQFANNGGANTVNEPNKVSNLALNTFIGSTLNEAVKIEYHVGFPGPNTDPLYNDNPIDASARTAFYGITSTPSTWVDGRTGLLSNLFKEETLKPASVAIDTIITANTPANLLNVEVRFTAKDPIPAFSALHIAIVEKEIVQNSALGTNGETSFKYVVKKLLPNAIGTRYLTQLPIGFKDTVKVSWAPKAYTPDSLAIVAFLQNEITKEVYQARILNKPSYIPPVSLITGMETPAVEAIYIYPNPANREVTLRLHQASPEKKPIRLIDPYGREVLTEWFQPGEQTHILSVHDFSAGLYFLHIGTERGNGTYKKLLIVH